MHKIIFKILILLLLNQCGYSSVYNNDTDNDIKISINNFEGNNEFNNELNTVLREYYNNDSLNIFEIEIDSDFSKKTISKDSKGKASNFELRANATFKIIYNNKNQTITFTEILKIKNLQDSFEQKKYENIIKTNFADSIKEKLILKLKTL